MAEQTVSVRLRAVTSGFQSAMRQAAGSMGTVHRNADRLTSVGMGLSATVTPAILGIGAAATHVGMQFESAMSGVEAVTGAGTEAMASMSEQAQELGRTTQFSATEAAGALEFLGMAGFDANEATEALPDTLSLAAAGGLELAQSADLASNVLQQFALDVEETGRVADVLAQTATNSNTSVSQLGQAMQMAGPVANAAGLELEETAAAIGAMGNAGIQASQAGTSLRGAMTRLLNASGPAAEVIAELGINAENADGSIRPLPVIIDQLSDSGATAGQMMEIFGQRAGPAMAALVEQGGDSLRDLTETIDDSAGAAQRMADVRMDNLAGDLKELGSAAEGAGIALFEAGIGDHLRSITQGATGALQSVAGLPDPLLRTGVALGGMAAAAGPAITGVGMIAAQGPKIAANFRAGLGAMRSFSSFLMGPWGIAIAAATAGLAVMIQRAQRMEAMGERLRDSLDGVAASADSLSDEWLIQELRQRDVLTTVRDMGIDLDTLREAIGGNTDAQAALNAKFGVEDELLGEIAAGIPGVRNEKHDLLRALEELSGETENYNAALEAETELLDYLPSATEQAEQGLMGMRGTATLATESARETAEATEELGESAEETAEDIDELSEALDTLAGSQLGVNEAQRSWLEALVELDEAIEENGNTLNTATEEGRANQRALEGGIEAAFEHGQAMIDNGRGVDEATEAVLGHIAELRQQAIDAGISEEKVDSYIDTLNLTPDAIETAIIAQTDEAEAAIQRLIRQIDDIPLRRTVEVSVRHGEGAAGGGPAAFFHQGGIAGVDRRTRPGHRLRANEIPAVLTRGEEVLPEDDPRHIRNAVPAQPRQSAPTSQSGPTYQFYTDPSDEGLHQVRKHEDRRMVREMAYG